MNRIASTKKKSVRGLTVTGMHLCCAQIEQEIPLIQARVAAGFPSPADDHLERRLDLNEYLIEHPAATFFVRVEGESMVQAGIHSGDLLIVDRAREAVDGAVVIAHVNGEFTVKRVALSNGTFFLVPENDEFAPIEVTEQMDVAIWGVVTYVIHQVR